MLLLLGLSRLPGGRQFTPQADATIELRVAEGDGRGKTFPETPVEIGVRLCKGAACEGQWVATPGLVREFDVLIPKAWQKLSQSLEDVQSNTASTLLNEMSLRRTQAEAEVRIVVAMEQSGKGAKVIEEELSHAEAAIKLDPTYAEAARAHIRVLAKAVFQDPARQHYTVQQAAKYMEQFRQDGDLCNDLCRNTYYVVTGNMPCLWVFNDPISMTKKTVTLSPELVQTLDAIKRLLERGIEDDTRFSASWVRGMMVVVFRGMQVLNVPQAQRQAWVEGIGRRCLQRVKRGRPVGNRAFEWDHCWAIQVDIAELLLEDDARDRAIQVLRELLTEFEESRRVPSGFVFPLAREAFTEAGDAQMISRFEQWRKRTEDRRICRLPIAWPKIDVFADNENVDSSPPSRSRLKPIAINADSGALYVPLAESAGRLYFYTVHAKPSVQYVPLDDRGQPIGKTMGDYAKDMPQPMLRDMASVQSKACLSGKLCLATGNSGLQIFNPKTGTWKAFGPEQGVPSQRVEDMFSIGGDVLCCTTTNSRYTLNLADGAVRLLYSVDDKTRQNIWFLRFVWRDGQRVMAMEDIGVITDLLGTTPKWTRFTDQLGYGWPMDGHYYLNIVGGVEVHGRRFCLCRNGLYEVDAAGKPIRTWCFEDTLFLGDWEDWSVETPADCPVAGSPMHLGVTGSRLVLTDDLRLTIYDLSSDTWYGPLSISSHGPTVPPLVTPSGHLWISYGQHVLMCYSIDDAMEYAKSVGRVITTAEFRQRKQVLIDTATPLVRGKSYLGMRQFHKAKTAFQEAIDTEPKQAEALILMGLLHEGPCLNEPDEAIKYYRRAAELEDDATASFTAMYYSARLLNKHQRWKETNDLCQTILQRFPAVYEYERQKVQKLYDQSREHFAKTIVKQSAGKASNMEEKPAK